MLTELPYRVHLYRSDALEVGPVVIETLADWDAQPVPGVQVLLKETPDEAKSRVAWFTDGEYERVHHDFHFYAWLEDGPSGVTPDAVLHLWAKHTGETDVRIADLSLDDFAAIHVKLGESIPNDRFNAILEMAVNDPEIP